MKAEKKPEGFVIYSKSLQSALLLPDEQAGRVLKAAARLFLMDEAPEELELSEEIVMSLFKGDIEDSINHHAEVCARNQRIAANRKAPSVTTHDESLPVEPNRTEIESNRNETYIIESKKEADKPPRAARFTPPTIEEVQLYCAERQNNIDAQRFVDFYLGMLLCRLYERKTGMDVRSWMEVLLVVLLFVALTVYPFMDAKLRNAPLFWLVLLPLILVFAQESGVVSRLLKSRPMFFLGSLTMPLFLTHQILIGILLHRLPEMPAMLMLAVCIFVILMISWGVQIIISRLIRL